MHQEIPDLLPLILIPALMGLIGALLLAAFLFLLYFVFFKSIIKTWFSERARSQPQGLSEEQVIAIVRKEIRDELIRHESLPRR
jgi:hypothetical protein